MKCINFSNFCTVHPFNIWSLKPTDVTIPILFIYRRLSTCFGPTGPSSAEFTQLFTQPLVQWLYCLGCMLCIQSTWPEQYSHWTNGCVNSCVNSAEDGPVGPKHVEIRQYMNKIGIVTSVGFSFQFLKFTFGIELYMFWTVSQSVIRSLALYTQQ
jgi:membrane protein insertase Oxa1/YidC/SpoIIIJ